MKVIPCGSKGSRFTREGDFQSRNFFKSAWIDGGIEIMICSEMQSRAVIGGANVREWQSACPLLY